MEAGGILATDPAKAEKLLREALGLDPCCGIAHNNLGSLLLKGAPSGTGPDLYAAAESFQTAAKLLPGRADPRVNLGIVMERAGRLDDALSAYASAVECDPSSIAAIQALTSLEVRCEKRTEQTRERLKTIALRGSDESWRGWARDWLVRSGVP